MKLTLNEQELTRWFKDRGDYTHNITYPLNENSIIMDLGGYTGAWAQQMINIYNPNVYILEPIPSLHNMMSRKFWNNPKVKLMNVGVAPENKKGKIYLSDDGSSSNLNGDNFVEVEFRTIESILNEWNLDNVDLLQINIEGDEYNLLDHMLETKIIQKIKNLQVQFHLGMENDIQRREKIRSGLLENNFSLNFDYPFVWESWRNNN